MTTLFIILFILVSPALVGIGIDRLHNDGGKRALTGAALGLSFSYFFFALGHYVKTEGMVEMLPSFVPYRHEIIWLTGLWEIGIAIGLLFQKWRYHAGIASIITLIAFFPANIYAASNAIGLGGHTWGLEYLLVRAPLQLFLIWWSYQFAVKAARS